MKGLIKLEARDLRCFEALEITPDPEISYVVGANASGKTSLLEAIFLIGRGRSFRAARTQTAIRDGAPFFEVVAWVGRESAGEVVLGLRGEKGTLTARADGSAAKSVSELARFLPVQVIDARVHELVEGAPGVRRRFLDWGVFHVKHQFLTDWRKYSRALKQRNAALKAGHAGKAIQIWDQELIQTAEAIDSARREYLGLLRPVIEEKVKFLLDATVGIQYQSGWRADTSFAEALASSLGRDSQMGTTHVGPHRADLVLDVAGGKARDRTSRGQQKLLASSCLLAQSDLIAARSRQRVLLLVDDPAAELDSERLALFLRLLGESPTQRIVTSLSRELLPPGEGKVFHVEQGRVQEVV